MNQFICGLQLVCVILTLFGILLFYTERGDCKYLAFKKNYDTSLLFNIGFLVIMVAAAKIENKYLKTKIALHYIVPILSFIPLMVTDITLSLIIINIQTEICVSIAKTVMMCSIVPTILHFIQLYALWVRLVNSPIPRTTNTTNTTNTTTNTNTNSVSITVDTIPITISTPTNVTIPTSPPTNPSAPEWINNDIQF